MFITYQYTLGNNWKLDINFSHDVWLVGFAWNTGRYTNFALHLLWFSCIVEKIKEEKCPKTDQ